MSEPQSGPAPYGSPRFQAPPPRRRPVGRTLLWILLAIGAALLIAVVFSPHGAKTGAGAGGRGGAAGGGGRRPPTVIGVAVAQTGDIPILVSALGTVTPVANVTVHTHIAGTLMSVNFREGQMVKAGQLLALVDERPYDIALQQAQGQLLRDQALLANAKLDLVRYQKLLAEDSIQSQQVDTQTALVKQDEGTVKTDEAAVNNARLNIVYCHITAPVSGRVGLRQVDPGNYVNIGDANGVVLITTLDPIDVEFSLPEDNVPAIAQRVASGATLVATAYDRTGATVLAQGQLLTLDNQIDTATGTIKAKARFHNASGVLFPSQFVNVQLLVDTKTGQVVVPTQAVRHGSKGDYVFTVEDGTAKMNLVKLGASRGERTAIDSGIKVGDQVITDGGDRLTDGATVLLPGQAPPNFNRKPKASGPLAWIASLFAPKSEDAGAPGAPSGGGSGGFGGAAGAASGAPSSSGGGARMQAMLDQLNLSADQKTKAAPILADMRAKMAAAGDDADARRAAMRDGMHALSDILTPEQQAKLAQLRAAMRGGGGGGYGGAPPAAPPAAGPSAPTAAAAPASAASSPPASGGGSGPGGDRAERFQRLAQFLGLDADQQAKAKAIFADGPSPEAFAKFRAILTPEQQAKLDARRAQRQGAGGNQ